MSKHKTRIEAGSRIHNDILEEIRTIATKKYTPEEIAELEAQTSGAGQDPVAYAQMQALSLEYNDFDIDPDGKVYARR